MPSLVRLLLSLCLAAAAGCTSSPAPRPLAVSPLPIGTKQQIIRQSQATLKNFQSAAIDLRSRGKEKILREFAEAVNDYIVLQVAPIVADIVAAQNLETRLEIARLQLLGGYVYVELAEYAAARRWLAKMETRYAGEPEILSATLDRNDHGFASIGEGLQMLSGRIDREQEKLPPLPWLPRLPGLPRT